MPPLQVLGRVETSANDADGLLANPLISKRWTSEYPSDDGVESDCRRQQDTDLDELEDVSEGVCGVSGEEVVSLQTVRSCCEIGGD